MCIHRVFYVKSNFGLFTNYRTGMSRLKKRNKILSLNRSFVRDWDHPFETKNGIAVLLSRSHPYVDMELYLEPVSTLPL